MNTKIIGGHSEEVQKERIAQQAPASFFSLGDVTTWQVLKKKTIIPDWLHLDYKYRSIVEEILILKNKKASEIAEELDIFLPQFIDESYVDSQIGKFLKTLVLVIKCLISIQTESRKLHNVRMRAEKFVFEFCKLIDPEHRNIWRAALGIANEIAYCPITPQKGYDPKTYLYNLANLFKTIVQGFPHDVKHICKKMNIPYFKKSYTSEFLQSLTKHVPVNRFRKPANNKQGTPSKHNKNIQIDSYSQLIMRALPQGAHKIILQHIPLEDFTSERHMFEALVTGKLLEKEVTLAPSMFLVHEKKVYTYFLEISCTRAIRKARLLSLLEKYKHNEALQRSAVQNLTYLFEDLNQDVLLLKPGVNENTIKEIMPDNALEELMLLLRQAIIPSAIKDFISQTFTFTEEHHKKQSLEKNLKELKSKIARFPELKCRIVLGDTQCNDLNTFVTLVHSQKDIIDDISKNALKNIIKSSNEQEAVAVFLKSDLFEIFFEKFKTILLSNSTLSEKQKATAEALTVLTNPPPKIMANKKTRNDIYDFSWHNQPGKGFFSDLKQRLESIWDYYHVNFRADWRAAFFCLANIGFAISCWALSSTIFELGFRLTIAWVIITLAGKGSVGLIKWLFQKKAFDWVDMFLAVGISTLSSIFFQFTKYVFIYIAGIPLPPDATDRFFAIINIVWHYVDNSARGKNIGNKIGDTLRGSVGGYLSHTISKNAYSLFPRDLAGIVLNGSSLLRYKVFTESVGRFFEAFSEIGKILFTAYKQVRAAVFRLQNENNSRQKFDLINFLDKIHHLPGKLAFRFLLWRYAKKDPTTLYATYQKLQLLNAKDATKMYAALFQHIAQSALYPTEETEKGVMPKKVMMSFLKNDVPDINAWAIKIISKYLKKNKLFTLHSSGKNEIIIKVSPEKDQPTFDLAFDKFYTFKHEPLPQEISFIPKVSSFMSQTASEDYQTP